jgi:hypothetical protein
MVMLFLPVELPDAIFTHPRSIKENEGKFGKSSPLERILRNVFFLTAIYGLGQIAFTQLDGLP